jgi:ribosomal protein S18 acetylase RimI-like enzyme
MSVDATKTMPQSSCMPVTPPPATPEHVVLRRATPADAQDLAIVAGATFLEAFTWMLPGADALAFIATHHTPAAYAAYLAKPDTRITLAMSGPAIGFEAEPGSPVGYAMLSAPDLPTVETTPADIELKRIYLFSRFRNSPVLTNAGAVIAGLRPAQALMDAALADARALGRTRLLLGTHEGNDRAIAFYRRNGFVDAGKRTFQVGRQRCCDLILAKHL